LEGRCERAIAEKLTTLQSVVGPRGEMGPAGPAGRDGRLRTVTDWSGGVSYEGALVHRNGSLWQCIRDTGHPPPHEDWQCLARAGENARTPRVRKTWSPDVQYRGLDIVALNGCSWIARVDNPGLCPGDDWQLIAAIGKRGAAGERGLKGDRGERGPTGTPAPAIVEWKLDPETYRAAPLMSDGMIGAPLDLRPLFERFLVERSGG
jgi:hypothetical protein